MTKEECLMATAASNALGTDMVENATPVNDPELVSSLEEEMMVWGYMMMQLHIMDMWKAIDPAKLSREEQM